MATLTPIEMTVACDTCDKKATPEMKIMLCSRCKMVRYCSPDCQLADWDTHKQFCVRVGSDTYYQTPKILNLPIDGSLPTNPLGLRAQPPMPTREYIARLCAIEKQARAMYAVKKREQESFEDKVWYVAPYVARNNLLLKRALDWRRCGNDPMQRIAYLATESKEDLIELLRRNLCEQLKTNDELKALSIMNQSNQLKATALRRQVLPDIGVPITNPPNEAFLQALMPEMRECKDWSRDCVNATDYMYGIKQAEHITAEWLLHSLLALNPIPVNMMQPAMSLLTEDRMKETQAARKIIRLLITLGAKDIDEGHFWALDDRLDSGRMNVNHNALMRTCNPWDSGILANIVDGTYDLGI